MAGSISLALSQQFDPFGKPYGGGQVYFRQAGTTDTPQNAYQDLGLTLPWPNPYTLLEDGRIPQVYFADGYVKIRITDKNGVQIFNQDNVPVTGPSSGGGGGGGGVDPTTVLQTGDMKIVYATGVLAGFVRVNGRTIGNASSGATERANSDTSALFAFLWNADVNLTVSGGRGVSAAADFAANKTIALPDFRGRALTGLDDMGNSAAGRLTSTYFGTAATVLGAAGGSESQTLTAGQLPANIPSSAVTTLNPSSANPFYVGAGFNSSNISAGATTIPTGAQTLTAATTVTINAAGGAAHPIASPAMLITIYVKL